MRAPVRIANCSGFYGDRLSAAREMVDGGPIDFLTGDWLAELTMLILAKSRRRDPDAGYAKTFVAQMEDVMGECLERGIKVVSNAGGLSPRRCADAVAEVAKVLGLDPVIAYVEGDDLLPRLEQLRAAGIELRHMDTGEALGDRSVLTANAYLGGWGIAEALGRGADIVITGRTTDASIVVGPAAWWHGWNRDDWDALAGAVVAGHVIECGTQATGGNYSFFTEVPRLERPGFPIAEVASDGSSVITKHPDHGGQVSIGTVTAQLLYEIAGPEYLNPDVVARFDSITLTDEGPDRVRISGVKGGSPPATTKVALNFEGGWRSTSILYLSGLDIEAKADLVERALWDGIPGGRDAFDEVRVQLIRTDKPDPATNEEAAAVLRITVKDRDERKVGRSFTNRIIELALASYPGYYGAGGPANASPYGVYWPATVPNGEISQEVVVRGERVSIPSVPPTEPPFVPVIPAQSPGRRAVPFDGEPVLVPLGTLFGARSGDKGGNANLGVWARSEDAFGWLAEFLSVEQLKTLLPETATLPVDRFELPNILSLNFVIRGLLGEGVAASTRQDAQAKSLGEWLRARVVAVPAALLKGTP